VADGCLIHPGAQIENSVVGLRCCIDSDVAIRNTVLMGADEYELPDSKDARRSEGLPEIGIGANTLIDGAIVDKNCRIGSNVRITSQQGTKDRDIDDVVMVRDGIVVVQKGASVPDGWSIEGK
jgi:glucose-1-phosphate adenylyltransferase